MTVLNSSKNLFYALLIAFLASMALSRKEKGVRFIFGV
jgi:hypothetical protein